MLLTGMFITPAAAATPGDSSVHITKMIVEPSGPDLNFTVYYESDFFTRFFSLFFGARVVQPSIGHVFDNFSNVTVSSIDSNNGLAKVIVKNLSKLNETGWYVYNGNTTFTTSIGTIEIHTSDGNIATLKDTDSLPVISNRMPVLSKY